VAARAISLQNRIGSLLPGYQADLAIINAPNVSHWLYHFVPNACVAVLKNGQWVA
jgi:imidazolonepropionase